MDYIIEDRSVVEMVVVWEIRQRSRHTIWWPSSIRATYPEREREWKHTAGVWEVRVRDGGAPVEHERQQHHAPAPLPPQRRLVLGLRLGGQMQGLRRAPPVVVVAMRAPAERERERERAVPHQDAGSEGNGGVCEGAKFSQMKSGGHTRITVKIIEKIANNRWKQPNWISNTSKLTCRIDNTDE